MKKTGFLSLMAAMFIVASTATAFAQNPNFNASRTFQFDPDKTGGSVAFWKNGIGETDTTCNTNFGLNLEKNAALSDNVSSGAVLNGLKGVTVLAGDTMGYDIKATSPCGAGALARCVVWWLRGSPVVQAARLREEGSRYAMAGSSPQ